MLNLLGALVLVASPPAFMDLLESRGSGPSGSAARDDACRKALRSILNRRDPALSVGLTHEAGSELDALLADPCHRVLGAKFGDEQTEDGRADVTLKKGAVDVAQLGDDYDAMVQRIAARPHPKLLLLLAERAGDQAEEHAWWVGASGKKPEGLRFSLVEQHLASALARRGWHVVDPEHAMLDTPRDVVIRGSAPTIAEAQAYASAVGVDYVVLGHTRLEPTTGSVFTCHFEQSAKVVRVASGEVVDSLAVSSDAASVVSSSAALLECGEKAASGIDELLVKTVLPDWKQHADAGGRLVISVQVDELAQVAAVVELLRQQPGVARAEAGDFADGHSRITLTVTTASPRKLASALSNHTVAGGVVHVSQVSNTNLALKVSR